MRFFIAAILSIYAFAYSCMAHSQEWVDVSHDVDVTKSRTIFNRIFRTHISQVQLKSRNLFPVVGEIRLVVKDANLPVEQPDGFDEDGNPFVDFPLDKIGFSDSTIQINFTRQGRVRPTYSLAVERYDPNSECNATHCYIDAVFFTTADLPVNLSVNFDNSSKAFSLHDETSDYGIASYYSEKRDAVWVTHSLYPALSYNVEYNRITKSQTQISYPNRSNDSEVALGDREPLILIHGWQGGHGENNYLGFSQADTDSAGYFQEFLAFYESDSDAAIKLREQYKLYIYKYPSFEHISYNGRMLGEAISSTPQLRGYIESGERINVLAHSMGGLVARSFIEEHGVGEAWRLFAQSEDTDVKGAFTTSIAGSNAVSKLITLATPHHGSPAAGKSWVDTGESLKNRETPGALDLMWDNFDNAINVLLINNTELARALSNDFYVENDQKIFFFRERGLRAGEGLDDFDKFYGEIDGFESWEKEENGQCVFTFDAENVCFEHPNPWLKSLNKQYFDGSSGDVGYYFYSGFLKHDNDLFSTVLNPIKNSFGLEVAHYAISLEGRYILNDGATVSASGFLDRNEFSSITGWQRIWDSSASNAIVNRSDKITQLPQGIGDDFIQLTTEDQTHYRFFYDYDHTQMKGGSGAQDYVSNYSPSDYLDKWRDSESITNYVFLLEYLDNVGARFEGLEYSPLELLKNEPLFISIAKDLGVETTNPDKNIGLIAHYPLDGNSDDVVSGIDGIVVGNVLFDQDAILGQSALFNGGSRIDISPPDGIVDEYTVHFFVKTDTNKDAAGMVTKHRACIGTDVEFFAVLYGSNVNGARQNQITFAANINDRVSAPREMVADNNWHALAISVGEGSYSAYIDGQLIGTKTYPSEKWNNSVPISIGGFSDENCSVDHSFIGRIDDVKIFNRALTQSEIVGLHPAKTIIFSDDFNRPDSNEIGNGWSKLIGGSSIELFDGEVRVNEVSPENVPLSGIYRDVDFNGDVTIKGRIYETNGYGGLSNRYNASIGILGDGTPSSGYHVVFARSDRNFNNSQVQLFDNGVLVQIIYSSFQFGSDISVEITFRENGALDGAVLGGTSQRFEFNVPPREVESNGDFVYFEASKPDVRGTSSYLFQRLDDFIVLGEQ